MTQLSQSLDPLLRLPCYQGPNYLILKCPQIAHICLQYLSFGLRSMCILPRGPRRERMISEYYTVVSRHRQP
ncbi:hypothetical protein M378DRAFT_163530 [Amanita muscaria Koide BX008]|uniref:Uncharacterized protein n=1 Tax=Amanita muscaria (strain Koide BX008) TaxID=946122 RepID=A0A0C2X6A5_AMAMK|nr:hypothetical protein M378DRAFT_163530 [Amanita muscaria Koide BX008]